LGILRKVFIKIFLIQGFWIKTLTICLNQIFIGYNKKGFLRTGNWIGQKTIPVPVILPEPEHIFLNSGSGKSATRISTSCSGSGYTGTKNWISQNFWNLPELIII
jgi:hypothetical protein